MSSAASVDKSREWVATLLLAIAPMMTVLAAVSRSRGEIVENLVFGLLGGVLSWMMITSASVMANRRWENVKALFKEMRRRRGKKNTLKIQVNFVGIPKIRFIVDVKEKDWFNMAVEKIDFVLELLPYHLDPKKLPGNVTEVIYRFDSKALRWKLNTVFVDGEKFVFKDNGWQSVKN